MSKKIEKAKKITDNLIELPSYKELFMSFMEYAYDNGYGDTIIKLFKSYLQGEQYDNNNN